VGAVHHLQNLVVINIVLQVFGNLLELLEVNDSVLVLVEEFEDSLNAVLGLDLSDLTGSNVDKLFKTDGLALFFETVDDPEDVGASSVDSQLLQHLIDFGGINGATSVLIKHLEGVLEFVIVLRSETVLPLGGDGLYDLSRA